MIKIARWPMVTIAYLFGLFHATLGIVWSEVYHDRRVGFIAVGIFVAALSATILLYKPLEIPKFQGLINLIVAALLPNLVEDQIDPSSYGTYATWYVGALGVLLGATALRGQAYFAWGSAVVVWVESIRAEGFEQVTSSGVIGLAILVMIGHATNYGLKLSEADIKAYNEAAEASTLYITRNEVAQQTRRETFSRSLPAIRKVLSSTVRLKGKLGEDDRRQALLLESELSDELLGGNLASSAVRLAARDARARGVEVYLHDEGGLETISRDELHSVLLQVAAIISELRSGRVNVRANPRNNWRISVTTFERGSKVVSGDYKF